MTAKPPTEKPQESALKLTYSGAQHQQAHLVNCTPERPMVTK